MDIVDLLSHQRLASGIPFGLALAVAVLLGLGSVALVLAVRSQRRMPRFIAAVLAVVALGRLVIGLATEAIVHVELNPAVRSADLYGDWRDGAQQLLLAPDSTFRLLGPIEAHGAWSLRDADLILDGRVARVIEASGERRILLAFPADPDLWNGHLGMRRAGR